MRSAQFPFWTTCQKAYYADQGFGESEKLHCQSCGTIYLYVVYFYQIKSQFVFTSCSFHWQMFSILWIWRSHNADAFKANDLLRSQLAIISNQSDRKDGLSLPDTVSLGLSGSSICTSRPGTSYVSSMACLAHWVSTHPSQKWKTDTSGWLHKVTLRICSPPATCYPSSCT